jgi:eukaryotic-like serine/threonine-protein kinase
MVCPDMGSDRYSAGPGGGKASLIHTIADGVTKLGPLLAAEGSGGGRKSFIRSPTDLLESLNIRVDNDLSPPLVTRSKRAVFGRYQIGGELGRGGMGQVLLARDPHLCRNVALKTLLRGKKISPRRVARFTTEAQLTAQLDHPNIMPVYEIGVLDDGGIYFTMKAIQGITLQEVLRRLRKRDPLAIAEYTQRRLLNIFLPVCMAMAYAHDRGVLHRDLKPANVMLGPFNEVLVMDWGLARVIKKPSMLPGLLDDEPADNGDMAVLKTRDGAMIGTPGYMSPEQLECSEERLDPRSDQFSLGAILYELITYRHAFPGKSPAEVQWRMKHRGLIAPRKRAPEMSIPEELEAICMRALVMEPDARFSSVLDLHHALDAFLEGARRKAEAESRVEVGREAFSRYAALRDVLLAQNHEAEEARGGLKGWASPEDKRLVWSLDTQAQETEAEVTEAFNTAMTAFEHALSHDPDNLAARQGLADLYWTRFEESEQRRSDSEMDFYRRRLETYDDGRYAKLLQGEGRLSVDTDPGVAEIYLYRYEPHDRFLVPGRELHLGYAPLRNEPIAMGRYLLIFHLEGYLDTRVPLLVGRRQRRELSVRMFDADAVGESFVHVPAGRFLKGGDRLSILASEQEEIFLEDFLLARFPVTNLDYLEFLNELVTRSDEAAAQHVPRLQRGGLSADEPCWTRDESGLYVLPEDVVEIPWHPQMPVTCVSWEDAQAYCQWLTQKTGRTSRLPTEDEWEKAGRGVDGRAFPWGDHFDPNYCKMRDSRAGEPEPEPVGAYPVDESPYGVRDMAGGVCEWCQDWHDEMSQMRLLRGGAWAFGARHCRVASRTGDQPRSTGPFYGFRVAVDVS